MHAPRPSTSSTSVTVSPPTTSLIPRARPTIWMPRRAASSVAAATHASPRAPSSGTLYVSATSASPVVVVRKRASPILSCSTSSAARPSRSGVISSLMRREPIGKEVTSCGVFESPRSYIT